MKEIDKYFIQTPTFVVRIDNEIMCVNEYTLRNMLIANCEGKLQFKVFDSETQSWVAAENGQFVSSYINKQLSIAAELTIKLINCQTLKFHKK